MRSEIHDVQVSKAGCMSEYDGLDDVVRVRKIWFRFGKDSVWYTAKLMPVSNQLNRWIRWGSS